MTVLRSLYVADPPTLGDDEHLLAGHRPRARRWAPDNYPGDGDRAVENWPGVGTRQPRGAQHDVATLLHLSGIVDELWQPPSKPPITWICGDLDAIVYDASLFDLAQLGTLGVVPGWPGRGGLCPPQPMIGQTRAVLERRGRLRPVQRTRLRHLRPLPAHRTRLRGRRRADQAEPPPLGTGTPGCARVDP